MEYKQDRTKKSITTNRTLFRRTAIAGLTVISVSKRVRGLFLRQFSLHVGHAFLMR